MINEVVETVVALFDVVRVDTTWTLLGRVIMVQAKVVSERALVGAPICATYEGKLLPHLALKPGLLCRMGIPLPDVERRVDLIAEGLDPLEGPVMEFRTPQVRPTTEPCVRVPLSLLRELKGQELVTESTRRALLRTWSEDRRTGAADDR